MELGPAWARSKHVVKEIGEMHKIFTTYLVHDRFFDPNDRWRADGTVCIAYLVMYREFCVYMNMCVM